MPFNVRQYSYAMIGKFLSKITQKCTGIIPFNVGQYSYANSNYENNCAFYFNALQ